MVQNIEDIVQESGLYGPLWEMAFDICSKWMSTHSWIFNTCQYNHDNKIKISIPHMELRPRRLNDCSIMTAVSQLYNDKATIRSINRVRMSNKVYHLSNITKDERSLSDPAFNTKFIQAIRNEHSWPVKHHTSQVDYTRWRNL